MRTGLALRVDEGGVTTARKDRAVVAAFPQPDEKYLPLNIRLDSVMIMGRQFPIRYENSNNGHKFFRYDGEKGEIVMMNLSRSNPKDHGMINQFILTALCDHGTEEDFWQAYYNARGI